MRCQSKHVWHLSNGTLTGSVLCDNITEVPSLKGGGHIVPATRPNNKPPAAEQPGLLQVAVV